MHHHSEHHEFDINTFDWNEVYSGGPGDYEAPDAHLVDIIAGLPPGRALDQGCGAGGLVAWLAQRGWQVTGIDIASKAIAAARAVLDQRGVSAALHVADATTWQPDGRYDLITSSFAAPGADGRAAIFRMFRDALAPGGSVIIKDFDTTMGRIPIFRAMDLVTLDEFTAAFDGFEIIRAEIVDTPPHDHGPSEYANEPHTAALFHARKPAT